VGLFMGAAPNVWLSGAYQNTGLSYIEYSGNASGGLGPIFSPDPDNQPTVGSVSPRQNVDIMSGDLKQPSVWKANLAFDHELPFGGLVASAELLLTRVKDAIYFERLDLGAPNAITGPDGRVMYYNDAGLDPARWGTSLSSASGGVQRYNRLPYAGDVMLARNTDQGSSQQFTISLEKPMADNWSWLVGYTYTAAKEVSPLTSSQNTSNWNNNPMFNANEPELSNSRYAIKDRFTAGLTYQKAFFGDYKTTASVFYEGRSGRPFSYVFYNDANGDSRTFNDLMYIPTGPGDVVFTDVVSNGATISGAAQEAAFFEWLARHPELKSYAGGYAPANAFKAGWTNSFDVRFSQELPGFMKGHKSEVILDIMNVGNLINDDWGQIVDAGFNSNLAVANFAGICNAGSITSGICPAGSEGKYVYHFTGAQNLQTQETNGDGVNTGVSRWQAQLTFRYQF
jgi:hypothetical protein